MSNELGPPDEPDTVYFFHGTRAVDSMTFSDGLRPLADVINGLWELVASLIPEIDPAELVDVRQALNRGDEPFTYGMRVSASLHQGPFGHLVRDVLLAPHSYSSVDYLAGPEIVVDMCQALKHRTAIDVLARYQAATKPCIVKFRMPSGSLASMLNSALWFVGTAANGERTWNANGCYDGGGLSVPASAIASVEFPLS